MLSKPCNTCSQILWDGDRYCVGCGRPVSWTEPKPTKEAAKILQTSKKDDKKHS